MQQTHRRLALITSPAWADVLVYSTGPFPDDVEVTGPVIVELYVESSAVDTDFTAKLVDVAPDGFARNLTDGIIRARYRNSRENAELPNPGQVYKVTIDLWSTSNSFSKASAASGDFEQQLPSIQPKSEHGAAARGRSTIRLSDKRYLP